jgi:PAS domain S-box-containing protein
LKLKVFHKGLILVGVPLLVELVLIASLSMLLNIADQEKVKEQTYRHYAALTAKILANASEVPYLLVASVQFGSDKLYRTFQTKCDELKGCAVEYAELLKQHPELNWSDDALKGTIDKLMDLAVEVGNAREKGNLMDLMNTLPEIRQRFSDSKDLTMSKLAQMVQMGEKQTRDLQSKQTSIRNLINLIIWLGIVLNIIVGGMLAWFYRTSIMERIRTISKNTIALSRGQRLQPEIGGGDEIALLDSSFHDMHKQLLAASARERALFNNASDVICVLDANNRFSKINPSCLRVLGYEPSEMIGVPLSDLVIEEDWPTTEDIIVNSKVSKQAGTFENRVKTKTGQIIELLWSAYWSESEMSLFCIVHDISEQKQIERIKKQFLSMISSDLKRPLSSISAAVSVLVNDLKEGMPQVAVGKLDMAKKNVLRLLGLVNDLLQVTEMDTGSLEIKKENCDIDELMRRSMQDVEAVADKQKVKLRMAPIQGNWYVDPNRIMQVLVNLLSNAIKFSPAEGAVLLTAERQGDYVLCKVIDQGRGVPESHKHAIFEKFKQVEAADGKRKSGTGLGLPICKQIIEEHGGIIGVESVEGKGSTFWFRLPVDETVSMKIRAQTKALQAAELSNKARSHAFAKMKAMQAEVPKHKQRPKGGSKLKLAWKGVILIGVPIAFELVFVGALSSVLMQVDHDRAQELRQRNIAFNASKLLNLYIRASVIMSSDKTLATWQAVEEAFAEAAHTKRELHKLVENEPEALANLLKVEQQQLKLERFVQRGSYIMAGAMDNSRVSEALAGRDKLIPVTIGVAFKMQKVVDGAEVKEFVIPEKQKSLRQRQGQILIAGIAANVLASVLLALFFTRDVTSRLTILADNASRLARDEELNPQIAGNDEIAQLDRVFHVTAMALNEARHKERAVFDNSQDVICAVSGEGVFTSMNPASEKMFGFTKEEMLSKSVLDITTAEDLENTRKTLLGDFGGQTRLSFENRAKRKDGSVIYVLWSASRTAEEPIIYMVAHDITNRKELEQLKQEFLAMVSHDLRTPLTSITGIAKLISAGAFGKVEDKPMQVLNGINKSADKLLELINDLLDIEKLEAGHMQLILEKVKLKDIVEKSMAAAPEGSKVSLEFYGDQPDIDIIADKDRLSQALGNIICHAVLRSNGVPVRFLTRNTAEAIEMQIIDAGPVMEEKVRNQLFDRFKDMSAMQGASVEERVGSGLAMPIARKIIESHSGAVSVLPQGSQGNIYFIRLPFIEVPVKA